MPGDGFTITGRIRKLLRSPSGRHPGNRGEKLASKVTLEKVLGITALGNSGLACNPKSGLVAYPAGCVVVLLNPKKNRQQHLINTSRKTITALSFSPDGKYLVTGESGHLPAVRLWDVAERRQVAELQKHKYGVSCVAFSPNSKYIVSVGNQHDMMVNVWAWKKDMVVAANKVSSKVTGVSFSEDSSYFVTVGNRHVKFWYLDQCKVNKTDTPLPLLGRSGLLGELRNNFYCDVACGRGAKSDSTFCITSSGLLCEFNSKRMLDKWVDLQTGAAHSLSLSEDLIFCGCADGTVRTFDPLDLRFVCTLPRPHPLGADVSSVAQASLPFASGSDVRYPASVAVTYDPVGRRVGCVYDDHSLYVWDVSDVNRVAKVHSALFHAACVWDLEMFPDVPGETGAAAASSHTFLSCSVDNTVRLWHVEDWTHIQPRNILSSDLLKMIYVDGNVAALQDQDALTHVNADKPGDGQTAEFRTGLRAICVSPDGKHLASGDRTGMLRVHDLSTMEEILKVEAHDAEILCLEYSKPETGLKLLATASRDRLIHVLDAEDDYNLVQTLDEHSSSITAVRFAVNDSKVRLVSCGADKSIYFHTAHTTGSGTKFRRSHHTVRKTTLYDMGVDPACKFAAVGCQDRCIRIFNINSGKQKKIYKGSPSEDGSLLRIQIDPSGRYVATSCSDKSISVVDFYTGECVATMFGHSEIVTGMKFTNDCKHLISASGDSCIFVWRLAPELTISMRERLCQLRQNPNTPPRKTSALRREVCSAPALTTGLSSDSDREREEEEEEEEDEEDGAENEDSNDPEDNSTNASSDSSQGEEDTGGSDEGQWEPPKPAVATPDPGRRPRRRWSRRMGSLEMMVKSMLDLRQLETLTHKKPPGCPPQDGERGSASSLHEPVQQFEEKTKRRRPWQHSDWLSSHISKGTKTNEAAALYLETKEGGEGSDYMVKELHYGNRGHGLAGQDSHSPDSACSLGYDSRGSSPDRVLDDFADAESVGQDSSAEENEGGEGEEQRAEVMSVAEALKTVSDAAAAAAHDCSREDFLKQNFEALAYSCSGAAEQSRVPRLSMSSRFLARGHNNRSVPLFNKAVVKEQGSCSPKPPVSKVRPLMKDGGGVKMEDANPASEPGAKAEAGVADRDCTPTLRPQKKKISASSLWRMSNPPAKSTLALDRSRCLQKSHSDQNLASDRSPPSPASPLSWESPKLKPQHSYMNPTASSMAKSSRSSSLGEDIQTGSSPSFPKGREASVDAETEPPLRSSSPMASLPSPPTFPLSPPSPAHPPGAALSPTSSFVHAVPPPSRIPLPKQPLSPRRSLCLEVKPNSSPSAWRASTPALDPACDVSSAARSKQDLGRHLSLNLDPFPPTASFPARKRLSFSESSKDAGQVAVTEERPAASEQAQAASDTRTQPGLTSPIPFTNLLVTPPPPPPPPPPLRHHSVSSHFSPFDVHPVCQPACPSPAPPPLWRISCCLCQDHPDHSVTVETCRQTVTELQHSLRRTIMLYSTMLHCGPESTEDGKEMKNILSEALHAAKADLDSLPHSALQGEEPRGDREVKGEGDKALALLEQYAELLVKSVERKLDTNWTRPEEMD